jgi:hypothetical protein
MQMLLVANWKANKTLAGVFEWLDEVEHLGCE